MIWVAPPKLEIGPIVVMTGKVTRTETPEAQLENT
jgi:hypothetical protein